MSWTALPESRWATRSCTTTWWLRSGAADDRHPVPRIRHRHGGRCARQGHCKPCRPRAWMGVDAESQSVLRRPGYLFLTFPGEVEAFTWVPRPAPLGDRRRRQRRGHDHEPVAPPRPAHRGRRAQVPRVADAPRDELRGARAHEVPPHRGRSRGLGSPVVGHPLMDATPNRSSEFPNVGKRRPLRPRDRRELEALPKRSDGCGSSAVGGAPTRRTLWSSAAARGPATSPRSSVLAWADDLVQ